MVVLLIALIIFSAFFSSAETAMMSLNRYRLRHRAKRGEKAAKRVQVLLQRPDRLLGVILTGNTFCNILASAIATMLAVTYWGEVGALIGTLILTLIVLIFSETAPKTLAALYPERVAFRVAYCLQLLLWVFYPVVWLVNGIANTLLRCVGVKVKARDVEPLSNEELQSVVSDASHGISSSYQKMLMRILGLEQVTVEDVMVPRADIYGIDIEGQWKDTVDALLACRHRYFVLYCEHIDQAVGIVSLRRAMLVLAEQKLDKAALMDMAQPLYCIPNTAALANQIVNFQTQKRYIGLVVDEYGDIQGLVTLKDIVEEIVGEFSVNASDNQEVVHQPDGSVLVNGSVSLRDLNSRLGWVLPVMGPRTLSGLVIDTLEMMPAAPVCCVIEGYRIEVRELSKRTLRSCCITPPPH